MLRKALIVAAVAFAVGCHRKALTESQVVLYTSVDDPFVRPLTQKFQQQTGIGVTLVTDAEASKTVGLAEKVVAERDHPRADVYWGNEPFHTIELARADVLSVYASSGGGDILPRWKEPFGKYQPIGLRARMIVISTRAGDKALTTNIHGLRDLLNPALKGKIAMSNPGFGTASGQVAAWYAAWGDDKADEFLRGLKANDVLLLGGNSTVVDQVANGAIVAGLTDNDDIANAKADGQPVEAVVPDQDGDGTLMIPTTIALVRGAPDEDNGKKLIDFLMTAGIEKHLIDAHFLAFSARAADSNVRSMRVDYTAVAQQLPTAVRRALTILQDR